MSIRDSLVTRRVLVVMAVSFVGALLVGCSNCGCDGGWGPPGGLPKFHRFKLTNNSGDAHSAPAINLEQAVSCGTTHPLGLTSECPSDFVCGDAGTDCYGSSAGVEGIMAIAITVNVGGQARTGCIALAGGEYLQEVCATLKKGGGKYFLDCLIVHYRDNQNGTYSTVTGATRKVPLSP